MRDNLYRADYPQDYGPANKALVRDHVYLTSEEVRVCVCVSLSLSLTLPVSVCLSLCLTLVRDHVYPTSKEVCVCGVYVCVSLCLCLCLFLSDFGPRPRLPHL